MIGNKLEKDIISLYQDNLVNLFSINQIAKKLGKKYPYINKKVTELLEERILKKIVVGKSYLCSLNFENEKTLLLLSLLELDKKKKSQSKDFEEFIDKTRMDITIHCIIIFNKKAVFVVDDIKDRRKIEREFSNATVVDKSEFLDLLGDDRQLFTDHTIIYGREKFFELLKLELDELKRLYSPLKY